MPKTKSRYTEIDVWRGLALIAMIIYHFFSILHFGDVIKLSYQNPGPALQVLEVIGWFARLSFIFLVGAGAYFSFSRNNKKIGFSHTWLHFCKRGLIVLAGAGLISLGSYFLLPDAYIRFGVLHFIGTALIFLPPILYSRLIALLFLIGTLILSYLPNIKIDLPSIIGIPLGLTPVPYTIDYFAIITWLPLILFGYLSTSLIYSNKQPQIIKKLTNKVPFLVNQKLSWLGRNTFALYFIHILIILLIVGLLKYTLQGKIL